MDAQKVPAGNGVQWISGALDLVKRQPAPFLLMGLILAIIGLIPILGSLVILILGPALTAGTCYAAQQADRGRNAEIGHLFQAFQQGDRIGSLIALCIPYVVAAIISAIIFAIFVVGAVVAGGIDLEQLQTNPMAMVGLMGASALIAVPLVIIVALIMQALVFFAIPETLLGRADAFGNMKASFAAARRNFGAFIVALLVLYVPFIIVSIILSLVLSIIGGFIANIGLYALLGPMLYFGWKDVFGGGASEAEEDTIMPPIPAQQTRAPAAAAPASTSQPPATPPASEKPAPPPPPASPQSPAAPKPPAEPKPSPPPKPEPPEAPTPPKS